MKKLIGFYKGKKVLLTGHTGFKGTWMSEMLCQLGAVVWGYALNVDEESFYSKVCPNIQRNVSGDIRDFEYLYKNIKEFQPEIIIHLASHSSLYGSMDIPHTIISTNLMGVENVLECARLVDTVKSVVIVTSDKVYEANGKNVLCSENYSIGATDPYGTSKVCQELLTRCYRNTFFKDTRDFNIATARASNCISIGDENGSRLFPYVLNTLGRGDLPEIRHKDSIRSWQYVMDVLYGYLLLARNLYEADRDTVINESYNFGPNEEGMKTVGNVVSKMCNLFGIQGFVEEEGDNIISESTVLKIDSTLAERVLGWKRKVHLDDAIARIVDMTKMIYNGKNVQDVVRQEVCDYLNN